jgi:hypothetical protein
MRALLESSKTLTAPVRGPARGRGVLAIAAVVIAAAAASVALYFSTRPPSVDELRAQVAAASAGYQCAALNYAVAADRSVGFSGHLQTRDDIERLQREITGIRGVGPVDFNVRLMMWPYCEVVAQLTPLLARPSRDAPSVTLTPKSGEAHSGDCLMLDVVTPNFDSYIYVDYFDAEGEVLHLLPNRWDVFNLKPPRNHFTLGKPPQIANCWRLGGATGEQLVSLVAARKPLFPEGRPDTESARDYIANLSTAINAVPQSGSAAAALFFNLRD